MPILTGTEDCTEYKNIKTVRAQQKYTLQRITVITERKKLNLAKSCSLLNPQRHQRSRRGTLHFAVTQIPFHLDVKTFFEGLPRVEM